MIYMAHFRPRPKNFGPNSSLVKTHSNVRHVRKVILVEVVYVYMKDYTQVRNHINVKPVAMNLLYLVH